MTDKKPSAPAARELSESELEQVSAAGKNLTGDELGFPATKPGSLKEGLSKGTSARKIMAESGSGSI